MILSTRVSLCCLLVMGFIAASGCSQSSSTPPAPSPQTTGQDHDHQDDQAHDHDHDRGEAHEEHKGDTDHAAENDDHEHPQSYAEAVEQLEALHAAIKSAFSAGDTAKADGPVHEVGHLLKDVPAQGKKAALAATDQAAVEKAVDDLFECFGQIDQQLHGGQGKSYDEVAAQIDQAMEILQSKVKRQQE